MGGVGVELIVRCLVTRYVFLSWLAARIMYGCNTKTYITANLHTSKIIEFHLLKRKHLASHNEP